MAKSFSSLRQKMRPAARAASDSLAKQMISELPLFELRQARQLSQEQLAEMLSVNQASVSKLERRTDLYLSTLRRFVEAMGGELDVLARFPEGFVRIAKLGDIEAKNKKASIPGQSSSRKALAT